MWQSVGTVPPDVSELEATGLFEGNQYVFRVAAENVVGLGEAVELRDSVIPKSQFGQLHIFFSVRTAEVHEWRNKL